MCVEISLPFNTAKQRSSVRTHTCWQHGMMRFLSWLAIAVVLGACSTIQDRKEYAAETRYHAESVDSRIKLLVMHYTALPFDRSLDVLTHDKVSAHYLVPDNPKIIIGEPIVYQLVPDPLRAWHAGISYWRGRTNINDSSIGIEIVNPGYTDTPSGRIWYPYTPKQIEAVKALAKDIIARYGIEPTFVVAHSDIAPQRKQDPGPLFPWQAFAEEGIGAWPDAPTVAKYLSAQSPYKTIDLLAFQNKLAKYGYQVPLTGMLDEETKNVIAAFQMHFRPSNYSGIPDMETEAILDALLEKYFPAQ